MNIHSIIPNSAVNGPGNRFVIWTQGCTLNCPGCWNQETHSFSNGNYFSCLELLERIRKVTNIEGITISGGEPFEQPNELFELTKLIREETNLSQIVYSGYTINEIRNDKKKEIILSNIDVLIDGRYNSSKSSKNSLIGSINQKHHFLTDRYILNNFQKRNKIEYHFEINGTTTLTGFPTKI